MLRTPLQIHPMHKSQTHTGVRDQFCSGGGGGEGGWGLLSECFIQCPKMATWKFLGGGGASGRGNIPKDNMMHRSQSLRGKQRNDIKDIV